MPNSKPVSKKHKLIPLHRRQRQAPDGMTLSKALERLADRAAGEEVLEQLVPALRSSRATRKKDDWKQRETVKQRVNFAKALYAARKLSWSEYVFFAASPAETFHEARWMDGEYDTELKPLSEAIGALTETLSDRYTELNAQYDAILDRRLIETFHDFELDDFAELITTRPAEYKRLRERGRRAVFHKDRLEAVLQDVVLRYEEEARLAASAGAYAAAITMLGAGVEGLLLLRCLRSPTKAKRVAGGLPRKSRPRNVENISAWTFEVLIETCSAAGWLPALSKEEMQYFPAGLAHQLRAMRNYVHPGRIARERPWFESGQRDYSDAEAIYVSLVHSVVGGGKRGR
jgi:hypothetical protein